MKSVTRMTPSATSRAPGPPPFLYHDTFAVPGAEQVYGAIPTSRDSEALGFMPDEETRECTKRMHYAAWRTSAAASPQEASHWRCRYYDYRDRIVLGNRKLAFRAVQKWKPAQQFADDMAAECQLILIKAVDAYNPWLGIRFSTYAFTCLLRALSRLSKRQAVDRLSRALPLDTLPYGEPLRSSQPEAPYPAISTLEPYLQSEHTLLTAREKSILIRRYHLHDEGSRTDTLEQVGRDLGLSKERVRQVQNSALGKLRKALRAAASTA